MYVCLLQDQFVFIHDALNDLIRCGNTEITASDIRNEVAALHRIRPGGEHISEFSYQFQVSPFSLVHNNYDEVSLLYMKHYTKH